ncbi:MAG: hypothetical protein JNM81_02675 [Rhodospirillaceae bacterium]|nr:hypothetical protein [Rhodospirillaceae bacterium]
MSAFFSKVVLAGVLALSAFVANAADSKLAPPKITLIYPSPGGPVFDRVCPHIFKIPVEEKWILETVRRRDEFQATWEKDGPLFLKTAIEAGNRPFPYGEMQATLSVCGTWAMAMPLLINVRDYMSDSTAPYGHDLPILIFHELMHHYTMPVDAVSPLRKKYDAEPIDVKNHMHVLAFEKYVLTKLGRKIELEKLDYYYRNQTTPSYKRAWEIVDTEGYQPLVDEVRNLVK